jgi:hypothetical protein
MATSPTKPTSKANWKHQQQVDDPGKCQNAGHMVEWSRQQLVQAAIHVGPCGVAPGSYMVNDLCKAARLYETRSWGVQILLGTLWFVSSGTGDILCSVARIIHLLLFLRRLWRQSLNRLWQARNCRLEALPTHLVEEGCSMRCPEPAVWQPPARPEHILWQLLLDLSIFAGSNRRD